MNGPAIALQPFTLTGPLPPLAPLLWDWSYTGDGIAGQGSFTTASSQDADGDYKITGITGSRDGDPIIGLEPAGTAVPGNAGYPVDNLINASGVLTANGFGYETADGTYANPYYANYLTPAIYQEVFTQPASGGFSEVPIDFQAAIVPGVTIATAAPGFSTDGLRLVVVQASQSGSLSLHGTAVQYLPAGRILVKPIVFSFDLTNDSGGMTPVVTVFAGGNGSQCINGTAVGYTDVSLGDGNSAVALHGNGNTVTLGNGNQSVTGGDSGNVVSVGNGNSGISFRGGGNTVIAGNGNERITLAGSDSMVTLGNGRDIVRGGTSDTINIVGNTSLAICGTREIVFIGNGSSTVGDFSSGLELKVGPGAGHDVLSNYAADPTGVVDLIGGIGGFTTTEAVLSALTSDHHGGSVLSFGNGGSLDFAGVSSSHLHASNFRIG